MTAAAFGDDKPRQTRRPHVTSRRRFSPAKVLLAIAVVVALLAAIGYAYWSANVARPDATALEALQSDDRVLVTELSWLEFAPRSGPAPAGLVIYPGALVDARAYAPTARAIASEGFFVAIIPVPANFAILAPDRAADVMSAHPEIGRWAVGGHSLGGVAAAGFARRHVDTVAGLVLLASYPADSDDLSASRLRVLSISATNDGLSTPAKIAATRRLLPATAREVVIEGGNHAQFGRYGSQRGDGVTTISADEQQARVVAAVVGLLREIAANR